MKAKNRQFDPKTIRKFRNKSHKLGLRCQSHNIIQGDPNGARQQKTRRRR